MNEMANSRVQYTLIFDKVILKQLRQAAKNRPVKEILIKMLDRIEEGGSNAGKVLDSTFQLFEIKNMRQPIRLYFKIVEAKKEAHIFEYEMKTSPEKQQKTIQKLKEKSKS